jgi:hypothetical protein
MTKSASTVVEVEACFRSRVSSLRCSDGKREVSSHEMEFYLIHEDGTKQRVRDFAHSSPAVNGSELYGGLGTLLTELAILAEAENAK